MAATQAVSPVPFLRLAGAIFVRHCSGAGDRPPSLWQERRQNRESMRNRSAISRDGLHSASKFQDDPEFQKQQPLVAEVHALGKRRQWEQALALFAGVPSPHVALREAIVTACAKAAELDHANRLFDAMPLKTLPAYNAIILMLARRRRSREAIQVFELMQEASIRPSAATYAAVITAHGMVRDAPSAVAAFDEMERRGILGNAITFNAVLTACGKAGDSQGAKALLSRMEAASVPIRMSHITSAIAACAPGKDEIQARDFLAKALALQLKPDVIVYTALIACARSREQAATFLAEMRAAEVRPDAYTYNQLLQIEVESGEPVRFQELIEQMEREGIRPNRETEVRRQQYSDLTAKRSSLPRGWSAATDPTSGRQYYWHEGDPNGSVTWTQPS